MTIFFSKEEDYAFKSQTLNELKDKYIEPILINILKSHRKQIKNSKSGFKGVDLNEIIDIYGLKRQDLTDKFVELFYKQLKEYKLSPPSGLQKELKNEYDRYVDHIQKKIIKNIKGILDGSVKNRSQLIF